MLQQKLAMVISDLTDGAGGANGYDQGPHSPEPMDVNGSNWQPEGYATPYGNGGGGGGQWSQGAATPYGATPYGQNGANAWP